MSSGKRIRRIAELPWQPAGRVLDPFAGERKWWAGLDTRNVTFVDHNSAALAEVLADAAELPFMDGSFDEVWADPPHIIKQGFGKANPMYVRFGVYRDRKHLAECWTAWAREFARVAQSGLTLKTIDGGNPIWCVQFEDLAPFHSFWTLTDEVRTKTSPGWSKAVTVYTRWAKRA